MEQGVCHGLLGHALMRDSVMCVVSLRCCRRCVRQKAATRCRLLATGGHDHGEYLDLLVIGTATGN
jgi:hypothetical protein